VTSRRTEDGDNDTDRKRWVTPRLRIFVRTRPDERVLANCKTANGHLVAQDMTVVGCLKLACGGRCFDLGS
jgi:hypothetical protein